ncbi:hypothetical protein PENTCL1PPCAC_11624 [Pristionchus entomophagus]|uniref:Integrase catalytic domain-containing protein n=1 Tax=Pristionchus entomophagus TaxID=358040 RepID=A0AAV5T2G8_9BILA|nr:hypothetical protein PENTCL1PPCAC_11624 [Pristionchus entomophagus]
MEIPNTLRKLRVGEIYHLYKNELEHNGEAKSLLLPESTVKKMIHICKAERRKSLHGVDIIVADAMESFENSETMIDTMLNDFGIDKSWHASLTSKAKKTRQYIRTDHLIHAKEYSSIVDHCWTYALSDPENTAFQTDCSAGGMAHTHSRVCDRCEAHQTFNGDMRATLEDLEKKFKKKKLQEIAVMRRDWYDWEDKIDKLKAHQLRSAKAEDDRQWILAGISEGDAMVTLDFAMKHTPLQGRETTTDWYRQRGMPWHVSHVTANISGEFHTHALIHIFDVNERQDSATVTAVIRHVLEFLKKHGIKNVIFRSDQAGAYKSSSTISSIQAIAKEVGGISVSGYYFSEAQAGKGPCDRTSAIVKGVTRSYADAGGKVLNPQEFFHAVKTSRHREGISYHLVHLEGSGKDKKPKLSTSKIPDMSKMNSFTFEEKNVRLHRFRLV